MITQLNIITADEWNQMVPDVQLESYQRLQLDTANAVHLLSELMNDKAVLLKTLQEIAERGPVEGYDSAGALRLRLVATQCIARAAIAKATNQTKPHESLPK